jgi:sigma-B regulation protein RsbU (phosphoserine phosphatase)
MTGSLNHLDATLIRAIRSQAFYFIQKPFDREVLLTLMDRCLELRRLASENRRHTARLEAELAAARAFQQGLLPPPAARINGLSIVARYLPCVELGGDFYDYAAAGPHCATLLIADAAGHGVSAAMLTAVVKSAFDASRTDNYEPQAIVHRVADGVRGYEYQRYVTMLCVRIDTARGVLEYVNAGHPAGYVWSNSGDIRPLASTGVFVSPAFADSRWSQSQITISPGDHVLLFTDGVSERESGEDVFGEQRVLEGIARQPEGGDMLLDSLLEAAHQFGACAPPNDDQALITATVIGHD